MSRRPNVIDLICDGFMVLTLAAGIAVWIIIATDPYPGPGEQLDRIAAAALLVIIPILYAAAMIRTHRRDR